MIISSFIVDQCHMNESRQSTSRNSANDSGFESATVSERSSTLDSRASDRIASCSSRNTPSTPIGDATFQEVRVEKPGK